MIEPARIAVNAQLLPDHGAGAVESVLGVLVSALGQVNDGPEEYVVIGPCQESDWLRPHVGRYVFKDLFLKWFVHPLEEAVFTTDDPSGITFALTKVA